jgi:hypothetical protein
MGDMGPCHLLSAEHVYYCALPTHARHPGRLPMSTALTDCAVMSGRPPLARGRDTLGTAHGRTASWTLAPPTAWRITFI